jgi:hypothetical protein
MKNPDRRRVVSSFDARVGAAARWLVLSWAGSPRGLNEGMRKMITSFEVGSVFRILDEASPTLRVILKQVRELNVRSTTRVPRWRRSARCQPASPRR